MHQPAAHKDDKGTALRSRVLEAASEGEAVEWLMENGMTDGLPVIVPTPERVEAMVEAAGLAPETALGTIPERRRVITVEKAAVNAVMAGCTPAMMPVVVAALQAVCDPRFSVHGPTATTTGTAILIIVNGPIVQQLGFNGGANAFGAGVRANATVGRAVQLTLRNAGGARTEEFERSGFGHPGKFTYCIAENEGVSPWEPFHVSRGLEPGDSAVTVFAGQAPIQMRNGKARTPEQVLATMAALMSVPGLPGMGEDGEVVVLFGQEHLDIFRRAGWSRRQVQEFLAERGYCTRADLKRAGLLPGDVEPGDEQQRVSLVRDPDSVLVLAAGGPAGALSCLVPGWTGRHACRAVTVGIPGYARPAVCALN